MKTIIQNLLSRKFLLALGTIIVFIANKQYDQVMFTVLGYCGINVADSKLNK